MIQFLDGPAAGIVLDLRRAPLHLRVVCDQAGHWDALDQLDDSPQVGEAMFAYRRTAGSGAVFLDYTDRRGRRRGQRVARATYVWMDPQPGAEILRDTAAWRAWCVTAAKTIV